MYKGSTPTFTFTFDEDFDPSSATSVILTFSANGINAILEKTKSELTIDSHSVTIKLTQAETLLFPAGRLYCQLNFVMSDGTRLPTDIAIVMFDNNLHDEVI